MQVADFAPGVAFYFDGLTLVMMSVITGVGFLIHLFSTEFMEEDISYARYFAYLKYVCRRHADFGDGGQSFAALSGLGRGRGVQLSIGRFLVSEFRQWSMPRAKPLLLLVLVTRQWR